MKFGRRLAAAVVVPFLALGGGLAAAGVASAAPVPTGYTAWIGHDQVEVSSLGVNAAAAVNAAGTLSLTVGSPSASTYAQAVVDLPAGSVLSHFAPEFVTDNYNAGSPRWVIELANGKNLFGYPAQEGGQWEESWSGAPHLYTSYNQAVTDAGGYGQVVKSAFIVADGDQAPGTTDTISHVSYGGTDLTVKPVYAPVPRLSHGHAVATAATSEEVLFTLSGAPSWVRFYIVGPGAINGHVGWVNAQLGVNIGYYFGLEAHHGYAVYYQPVVAQGSAVPVPGSHMGYVYFVSGANVGATAAYTGPSSIAGMYRLAA
jgi:hypothetical protein